MGVEPNVMPAEMLETVVAKANSDRVRKSWKGCDWGEREEKQICWRTTVTKNVLYIDKKRWDQFVLVLTVMIEDIEKSGQDENKWRKRGQETGTRVTTMS